MSATYADFIRKPRLTDAETRHENGQMTCGAIMTIRNSVAVPRALCGPVRANDLDPASLIRDISAAVTDMRNGFDSRFAAIEAAVDQRALSAASDALGLPVEGSIGVDPEYSKTFATYTRRGDVEAQVALKNANAIGERGAIQAAMSEGDSSAGGYLAPVEWDRKIQKAQRELSPMRRISAVVTTARSAYSTLWSDDLYGSGWVGETAARPATSTASFSPLVFPSGEIYANPAATQRLLDDSAINLEQWLASALSDEFARQEAIAFVSGDGVNKPMGFLRYAPGGTAEAAHPGGALGVTVSGGAAAIASTDALVDLKYALGASYRQNAVWLMNSQTAAVIAKMKDGQGNYIWRESLLASEPATLLGRPVEIDEGMPNIAANALPVAFGDFSRGYLVNDRTGVRILRDPYTNKPYVMFYSTKRVGGGVLDPNAIRVLKIAAS